MACVTVLINRGGGAAASDPGIGDKVAEALHKAGTDADIELISGWIDDGCPETDAPTPEAGPAAAVASAPQVLDPADTNAFKQQAGEHRVRQTVLRRARQTISK